MIELLTVGMKHIFKILALLAAISAFWIGLLQTSIVPRSYTWLVSFSFSKYSILAWISHQLNIPAYIFLHPYSAVTSLPDCFSGMLWTANGWSWLDAISDMSWTSTFITTGTFFQASFMLPWLCSINYMIPPTNSASFYLKFVGWEVAYSPGWIYICLVCLPRMLLKPRTFWRRKG